jgi:transcriptional regulator with XRE-family HTH domain
MKGLKIKRIAAGMTLNELSKKMGVSLKTIYNYESGKREPNFKNLNKLTLIFNCKVDELL